MSPKLGCCSCLAVGPWLRKTRDRRENFGGLQRGAKHLNRCSHLGYTTRVAHITGDGCCAICAHAPHWKREPKRHYEIAQLTQNEVTSLFDGKRCRRIDRLFRDVVTYFDLNTIHPWVKCR